MGHLPVNWLSFAAALAVAACMTLGAAQRLAAQPLPMGGPGDWPGAGTPSPDYSQDPTPRARRQIIVRMPTAQTDAQGALVMTPEVEVAPLGWHEALPRPSRIAGDPVWMAGMPPPIYSAPPENIPLHPYSADPSQFPPAYQMAPFDGTPVADPMFEAICEEAMPGQGYVCSCDGLGRLIHLFHQAKISSGDHGFGYERVGMAPFFIEVTQPQQQYRLRFDAVYNLDFPDRAEYFWARPSNLGGRGPPAPELWVDYQDFAAAWELGNDFFSTTTNIPIRVLDPVLNPNTAGLSDIDISTKLRLLNGDRWQITQFFRTYVNSGAVSKGLGTGHVSLEPGLLCRYRWNDSTYLHNELRYWFAVGGHPSHSGQVLRWGFGVSTILYESDSFAVMPTLEFVHLSFLDGEQTPFFPPVPFDIDGETVNNLHPGVRMAWDSGGDLGIIELGIASGIGMGPSPWWDSVLRIEMRWIY